MFHDEWRSYRKIETANRALYSVYLVCDLQAEVEFGDKVGVIEIPKLLWSAIKETDNANEIGTQQSDLRIQ